MFVTLGLIAGGGMALAAVGSADPTDTATACPTDTATPTETVTPTAVPTVTSGDTEDPTGDDQQGDDEQSCDATETPTPTETEIPTETETPAPPTDNPDRAAECATAAGVDPTAPPADPTVKVTGLDNALAHVLANCLKNPDAPGLPNALEHLVANAARKAAHDAAKAAGVHGNSANAHSGEVHGNSANAHSGVHGNPHV
jgi:hypothetical protein